MITQNTQTYEALKHYVNFPTPPMFAIFLSGAWGTGKTFFIKKFIQNELTEKNSHIYISLYGLSTPKDIDTAIFKKTYPLIASKASGLGQRVTKAVIAAFSGLDLDFDLQQIINPPKSKLYIFDDFERCEIPYEQILGYVNNLVEHDKVKAIIIGHETEISDNEKYRIKREKVIGRTFQIFPDFDAAWETFLTEAVSQRSANCLSLFKKEVSTVYNASKVNNLRILQQTIWDYTRLHECFEERHEKDEDALRLIINIFFALAFEVKSGKLSEAELQVRSESYRYSTILESGDDPRFSTLGKIEEKYAPIQIASQILSDKTIIDLLIKGHIIETDVCESLNQSHYFASPTVDSWRIVWHGTEIEESLFEEALIDFNQKFESFSYTVPSEIMHVFGLKLWLAKDKLSSQSVAQVKTEVENYIDTLFDAGQLEPLYAPQTYRQRWDSYGGLGYMHGHTDDFKYLAGYLNDKRLASGVKMYATYAKAFMESFELGPYMAEEMLLSSDNDAPYRALPYMTKVNIPDFISIIMNLHPAAQQQIFSSLALRYSEQALERKLAEEGPWLIEFTKQFQAARAAVSRLSQVRITRLIAVFLKPVFDDYPDLKAQVSFDDDEI